jgi:hypothetical protein
MPRKAQPWKVRFWLKIDKNGPVPSYRPELGPCWIWTGTLFPVTGYGGLKINGRMVGAHCLSYKIHKGRIPKGKEIDHLCRVRKCVNPDHLEAVTHKVNTLRGFGPAAVNARKTHCPQGHPLAGYNALILKVRGKVVGRSCRTCRVKRTRKWVSIPKNHRAHLLRCREYYRKRKEVSNG